MKIRSSIQSGFTLVEIMIVVAIIGILAAIVVPKFSGRTEQARATAAQTQIATFGTMAAKAALRDVGRVRMGGEIRRGAADLDGEGEVVSGVVVMRYGENARDVIHRVERKLRELKPSLPAGVEVVVVVELELQMTE